VLALLDLGANGYAHGLLPLAVWDEQVMARLVKVDLRDDEAIAGWAEAKARGYESALKRLWDHPEIKKANGRESPELSAWESVRLL
jgi:hypothetical protein